MIRILFFGRVSDAAGRSEMNADLPPDLRTVGELRAWLADGDGILGAVIRSPHVRVAVDRAMCGDDEALVKDAEEIAFMSPLSGG